ncbi:MAG: hypothetical protein ACI30J_08920 [Paludibacteraceae bacterium]
MLEYGEICANCIVAANKVMDDWCELSDRSANFGEPLKNPYDIIPMDDLDGGVIGINEMCQEIKTSLRWLDEYKIDCYNLLIATKELVRAFCEIIGEPYSSEYLQRHQYNFWLINNISCKYAFTLLEMWWVVNEYVHWLEKYNSREQIEIVVKSWYAYHENGGKTNLLHWLMGAIG